MVKRKVNSKNVFDQLEHRRKTGNSGDAILRPWQQKKRKNYHPELDMERDEQKGAGVVDWIYKLFNKGKKANPVAVNISAPMPYKGDPYKDFNLKPKFMSPLERPKTEAEWKRFNIDSSLGVSHPSASYKLNPAAAPFTPQKGGGSWRSPKAPRLAETPFQRIQRDAWNYYKWSLAKKNITAQKNLFDQHIRKHFLNDWNNVKKLDLSKPDVGEDLHRLIPPFPFMDKLPESAPSNALPTPPVQAGSGITLKDFYANMPVGSSQFTDQIANHLKFRYTLPAGQVGGKLQKGGMSIIKGGSCCCKRNFQ